MKQSQLVSLGVRVGGQKATMFTVHASYGDFGFLLLMLVKVHTLGRPVSLIGFPTQFQCETHYPKHQESGTH